MLRISRDKNPKDAEVHGILAQVYMALHDYEAAETSAKQAIAIDPNSPVKYILRRKSKRK